MSEEKTDAVWVGFDLGGTKMLGAVFDGEFRQLGRKRRKTKGHEGAEVGLDRIADTIRDALDEAKVNPEAVRGIGVGCPGPLDLDRGMILDAPNLGWTNVAVKEALEREFRCPVAIANDVDLGVYGEYRLGAAQGARCVLGVFPGTGIGGGCVYEGQIIRGRTNSCMEFGHIRVLPDGPLCGCGLKGCVEAVASRLAISSQAAAAVHRGQAPKLKEIAGTDLAEIRSGALATAIEEGDTVIEHILNDAARHIGQAVASVVHLLAPDVVVLGGGLVEAMPRLFVTEVTHAAQQHVMPSYVDTFRVVAAKLGDDSTISGAAAWAQQTVTSGR